jgi:hypothetical protein
MPGLEKRLLGPLQWMPESTIRHIMLLLLLLVLVGSVPYVPRQKRSSFVHCGLYLIAYVLAIVFCLEIWMTDTAIHYLTHITTLGMDYAAPAIFSRVNPEIYNSRISIFFWWSLLSGAIVVANWAILTRLARQWSAGIVRRLLWTVLLIIGIASTSAFVIWIKIWGLRGISPDFAEVGSSAPLHCWIAASLVVLILTTVITYRMTINYDQPTDIPQSTWRLNPKKYYHERRCILLFLAIAMICFHYEIYFLVKNAISHGMSGVGLTFSSLLNSWSELVDSWIGIPYGVPIDCLLLSVILLALHRAFVRREDPQQPQSELPRINSARFVTIWFAALAVIISGIPTLVWMSLALWFNPWFRGRWP